MAISAVWPGRASRPGGALRGLAFLSAAIVILPVAALCALALTGDLDYLRHLAQTRLGVYVRNSAALAALVTLGTIAIGAPAAWLVTRYRFPGRAAFSWLLALPLAAPAYVTAYAYNSLTSAGGPIYAFSNGLFPTVRGLWGAAFIFTLALYPYVYLLARQAFLSQGAHVYDAARCLGANAWRGFLRIGLPLARPGIAAGAALAVMETLADYGAVDFLGAPTLSFGVIRAWTGFGEPETAARLAILLLLASLLAFSIERAARRGRASNDSGGRSRPVERVALSWPSGLAAAGFCSAVIAFALVVPAARLAVLTWETPGVRSVVPPLLNTIALSAAAALVAVAIGLGAAYALRTGGLVSRIAARTAQTGYAIPGAVAAVGVLALLGFLQTQMDTIFGPAAPLIAGGGQIALVFAYQTRFAAAAIGASEAALLRVSPNMDAAAMSLGASATRLIWRIHVPLMSSGLAVAGLIVFVEVMKELPATLILRPFDYETLAIMAHNYAADERLAQAAAPSLSLIALGLPAMLAVTWLSERSAESEARR